MDRLKVLYHKIWNLKFNSENTSLLVIYFSLSYYSKILSSKKYRRRKYKKSPFYVDILHTIHGIIRIVSLVTRYFNRRRAVEP